jgi:hypothetical protein
MEDSMSSKKSKPDWNELEYISWKEFKKMAPPIIKLEINHIGELLNDVKSGSDIYNAFIKTRYELPQFIECLALTNSPPLPDSCSAHLGKAILNLPTADSIGGDPKIIHYILDRLNYVYNRIGMIY